VSLRLLCLIMMGSLAGCCCWAAAGRSRMRRSWCSVMKSWCSGARSPGPSRTGPTAPSWRHYPSCCQPRCAPFGSSHRARYGRAGTAARWGPSGAAPDRRPRRAGPPRWWTRHGDAELRQLALDPPMAPRRILPRQAQHKSPDTRGRRRTAGPAPPARVVLSRGQPAVPGQEHRGRAGNTSAQRRRDTIGASAANQARSAGSHAPGRPAGAAPHSHAGAPALRPLSPGHRGTARPPGRVSARSARRRS
jgi:hypothetical protein